MKKSIKDTRHDVKIVQDVIVDLGSEKDISMIVVTLGKHDENYKYDGDYTISVSSNNTSYATILAYSPTNISPTDYLNSKTISFGDMLWDTQDINIYEDYEGYQT